jgi:hypothetical protein
MRRHLTPLAHGRSAPKAFREDPPGVARAAAWQTRAEPYRNQQEGLTLLTLDLHPIFRNNRDIELALRQTIFKAARTGETVVEIIPGKGSGQLKRRALAFLGQKHIKKLYDRVEPDPDNPGRLLVHFRPPR